jgi:hypothetical protein
MTSPEPKREGVSITSGSLNWTAAPPAERSLKLDQKLEKARRGLGYKTAYFRETFSDELWQAMEYRGLTQAQFAEKAGVPKQFLTKVFRGGNCTMDTIVKLSFALNFDAHVHLTPSDLGCVWIHWVQEITPRQIQSLRLWAGTEYRKVSEQEKELEYAVVSSNS